MDALFTILFCLKEGVSFIYLFFFVIVYFVSMSK